MQEVKPCASQQGLELDVPHDSKSRIKSNLPPAKVAQIFTKLETACQGSCGQKAIFWPNKFLAKKGGGDLARHLDLQQNLTKKGGGT